MRVQILANSTMGNSFLMRAGRAWPTDAPKEVEVLDVEPPPVKVKVPNSTTGLLVEEERPDPDRLGPDSYAAVKADRRLRIVETNEINTAASDARVAAARAQVERLAGELSDAEAEIAGLKTTLEQTAAESKERGEQLAKATAEIERLGALLDAATAPATNVAGGGAAAAKPGKVEKTEKGAKAGGAPTESAGAASSAKPEEKPTAPAGGATATTTPEA
jgi:hypothetical protein